MNLENSLLMIPGPVPVVPRILRAMSKPVIGHRGKEFGDMYNECRQILAELFGTKNDVFIISGSGTCAMEAAIGNVIGEKDTVVTIENGKFGERFREIGERYGTVKPVKFDWTKGESIELDKVEKALAEGAKAEMFPRLNKYSRYSNTVTAMKIPDGIDDKKLRGGIKELGVQVSGGQGPLDGRIFRIGSMGNISTLDILGTIQALEFVLNKHSVVKNMGAGVEAAGNILK